MALSFEQLKDLQPPFYRVTVKALLFDSKNRLVLVQNQQGEAELPGGGIERDESVESCARREVAEETGATVVSVSPVLQVQTGETSRFGWPTLRLIVRADISEEKFRPGADMQRVLFVAEAELPNINFTKKDAKLIPFIRQQWQGVPN